MLLNVKQRLLLLNILPGESNYITLKVIREQQERLSFSEEELKRLKVKREGDRYIWDETIDVPVDIEIGESARGVIKLAFRELDQQGQLKVEFLPLYEHFMEGEDWPPSEDTADEEKPTPIHPD
ncbi:hypothetical protein LCGC14_0899310 [marine sediment metagenome]|uniref:Uncharacterized protein n=1 Tax=marine sediment metagenome TaxID=412755 RepID=A0A0F9S3T5_9ZZZZ